MLDKTAIYQINLDSRTDRWNECRANHEKYGFSSSEIERVQAVEDKDFGAVGCAKSHIKSLSLFFINRTEEYCLVLEDDFDFSMSKECVSEKLRDLEKNLEFDLIMLSGTFASSMKSSVNGVDKLMDGQSACAYLVRRAYVPDLISCFMKATSGLERYRNGSPREAFYRYFAIDQFWKLLQKTDKWYIFNPVAGLQRPSFSNIDNKYADYTAAFRR